MVQTIFYGLNKLDYLSTGKSKVVPFLDKGKLFVKFYGAHSLYIIEN